VRTVDYKVMRSRSTTHPTVTSGHHRRSRSNPRQLVRHSGEHAALTDVGLRRTVNQDALLADERLFAVADGVGGGPGGEVAAGLAVDALAVGAATALTAGDLRMLAGDASAAVYDRAGTDPALSGMATTLTAGLFLPDGRLAIAHAGDSRAYRVRGAALEALTEDHALVAQLVAGGVITADQAEKHPLRNLLTRAIGRDRDTDFDVFVVDVEPGDVFLFCTDGLTKMLSNDAIAAIVAGAPSLNDAALALVRAANAAGGRDNVTVVLAAAPGVTALAA
jgi:serine/threonine protein phosphatase PrpC